MGKLVASLGELNDGVEKLHRYIKYQCDPLKPSIPLSSSEITRIYIRCTGSDPTFDDKRYFASNFEGVREATFLLLEEFERLTYEVPFLPLLPCCSHAEW